jgi:hypothetical protein
MRLRVFNQCTQLFTIMKNISNFSTMDASGTAVLSFDALKAAYGQDVAEAVQAAFDAADIDVCNDLIKAAEEKLGNTGGNKGGGTNPRIGKRQLVPVGAPLFEQRKVEGILFGMLSGELERAANNKWTGKVILSNGTEETVWFSDSQKQFFGKGLSTGKIVNVNSFTTVAGESSWVLDLSKADARTNAIAEFGEEALRKAEQPDGTVRVFHTSSNVRNLFGGVTSGKALEIAEELFASIPAAENFKRQQETKLAFLESNSERIGKIANKLGAGFDLATYLKA